MNAAEQAWVAQVAARALPHVRNGMTVREAIPVAMAEYTKALDFYSDAFCYHSTFRPAKAQAAVSLIIKAIWEDVRDAADT